MSTKFICDFCDQECGTEPTDQRQKVETRQEVESWNRTFKHTQTRTPAKPDSPICQVVIAEGKTVCDSCLARALANHFELF